MFIKDENGNVSQIQAKELVIYVNSVSNIVKLIKKTDLKPDEVNILCADTRRNRTKI